ncbi:DUF4148 domain-containing protein [Noviherbaspirillum malthae]|uniref:DUF4148 domain-containing protein n=1 Tax=Noviherbaspirillum malthae TaxID=1260987 RepID=UPI0018901197|nr:DUF4148 domain-containing protein [Noviherbaspirillum malthae]
MKVKYLIAAVVLFTDHSAFADDIYPYVDQGSFTGTRTRAEVRAELERAHAEGNPVATSTPEFVEFTQVATTLSRRELGEEAARAARAAESGSGAGN